LFFGFPVHLFFLPVHVRKREGGVKPATAAQFFWHASGSAVKIRRSC
jgi:hypothetical protein